MGSILGHLPRQRRRRGCRRFGRGFDHAHLTGDTADEKEPDPSIMAAAGGALSPSPEFLRIDRHAETLFPRSSGCRFWKPPHEPSLTCVKRTPGRERHRGY